MNLLFRLAYKGTRYGGFQVQPNAPTVCAAFQDALQAVTCLLYTSDAADE